MGKRPVRILLIEDNAGDAMLLSESLEESPFDCVLRCVERLSSALSLLREDSFDLVFMDMNLPDSCGEETLRRITSVKPGQAVIILTGTLLENQEEVLRDLGVRSFLRKGLFDEEELWKAIREAIDKG